MTTGARRPSKCREGLPDGSHGFDGAHSYTYTVCMKNVTLSIDEDVLSAVRTYAAERNSSVNALVREFLTAIAHREDRAKKARQRIRELSESSDARIGSTSWSRDELHAR